MQKQSSKGPEHRDPKLVVGRLAALSFSIGVVAVLMFRAGLGCGSPEATPEPGGSASSSAGVGAVSVTASASASAKQKYLGGSKAWGDGPLDDAFGSGSLGSAGIGEGSAGAASGLPKKK